MTISTTKQPLKIVGLLENNPYKKVGSNSLSVTNKLNKNV